MVGVGPEFCQGVACYYFDTCQTIGIRNENPAALKHHQQQQQQQQQKVP